MRISRAWTGAGRLRRAATAGALVVALFGVAACTGTAPGGPAAAGSAPASTGTPPTPADAAPTPASGSPAAQVPDVLRFTGTTLGGAAFDAARLAGKPVVLWFWAPWCATCASQAWTVAEIEPRYRDTVPIVGVAGLGERKAMKEFVTEFDLGATPQIEDTTGALWKRFKVTEQSIFVIIDRNGTVVHHGFLDGEALTAKVAALAGA
ncbi:TlpA family protein disulfide reductase [Micromonospora hortensis]|uniref:TlpA family protein disulfide reductase n=1 Tax=Micromonospora hortensis TaxID=2911209 RepID=UPI001EE8CFFC|nr:thioredoxin-like domain-containing protein [Micromonospora hortensis]MCG5452964.1 redoxin domain-containing protein [Micromonospora hortensis]